MYRNLNFGDRLITVDHPYMHMYMHHYTVDRPWYTWIHCIHAGTPRGYYNVCVYHYTVDRPWYTWIHCIHAGIPRDALLHSGPSMVYMDTLYPCGHTKGLLCMYHYTVDRPWYTWIHCIHAGIPRGALLHSGPSMVYMDTLYPCGHTKGLLCMHHYTVDHPRYTWIHCIHAGTPRGYYVCTITQWTVHGIHGYIVSMRAHQGAIMCVPLHSGPSTVYMDTLYPCRHTKGLLCMYHYTVDRPWYTWIHCIHAGTPGGYYVCTITQWTVHPWYTWIHCIHVGAIITICQRLACTPQATLTLWILNVLIDKLWHYWTYLLISVIIAFAHTMIN